MAIAVDFHAKGMTLDQFTESHRRLDVEGASTPAGRIHHACFGADGDLMVYQVWESTESFGAVGATLMPILVELGIDPGEPSITALHRLEQTSASQLT